MRPSCRRYVCSLTFRTAFFACFLVWPFTARFGRRWSIALASLVFEVGAILQLFYPGNSVGCWYAGRTISGFGVGIATTIIPMYSAEMAPKHMRGQLGSLFQGCFTLGVFTSYWVTYGASIMTSSTHQWRIPVGLQLLFGGLLGLGMLFTKESTRWLAKVGRHEEALKSLVWVRGGEYDNEIQAEMDEIHAGIAEEERLTQGLVWKEYLLPANRWRIILVVTLQIGVQLTGNTSLAYFAPQFFAAVGAGDNSMLLSGFFGLCKVVACFVFLLFLVERIGRRWALLNGAFWMAILMLIVAVITATEPPTGKAGLTRSASAAIGMIYIEAMVYNISWGPVPCKCHVSFSESLPIITRAVYERDLPNTYPRGSDCHRYCHTMAIQLCIQPDHSTCNQESRVENIPNVCNFQLLAFGLHLVLH